MGQNNEAIIIHADKTKFPLLFIRQYFIVA